MKIKSSATNYKYFFAGGLAEFVSDPTPLTLSFFNHWFSGSVSLGRAMNLLGLPCEKSDLPLLEILNGKTAINLKNEEATLYRYTIFKYASQKDISKLPRLVCDYRKIFCLKCLINTGRLLLKQSLLISNPEKTVEFAKNLIRKIPETKEKNTITSLDELLGKEVWPVVLVTGLLSEFFQHVLSTERNIDIVSLTTFINMKVKEKDWFFYSLVDRDKVSRNKMSVKEYMKMYGMRADNDYELSCPRWHEIPDIVLADISPEVKLSENLDISNDVKPGAQKIVSTLIELNILRSEVKRKTLVFIDLLRYAILAKAKNNPNIWNLSKKELLLQKIPTYKKPVKSISIPLSTKFHTVKGIGTGISTGVATGIVMNLNNITSEIKEGAICVFPNASPQFSTQYPRCKGIIFLSGGLTSHGSIVAREYGIPGLVDPNAAFIRNGAKVMMNGETGKWQIIE